jgi:hypothetical protein
MIVHRSIIHTASKTETTQCLPTNEWVDKMWCMYITEHYLAIKKHEAHIHVTTWMDLENNVK